MMSINKLLSVLVLCFISGVVYGQVVSDQAELNNAISAAGPGTTITLADGEWRDVFIDFDMNGLENAPITITAQNPGAVLMTGNSRVYMEGSYLTITGLVFQDPSNLEVDGDKIKPVIELKRCNNCKVLDNKIDAYNGAEFQKELTFKWILNDGQYNEIAYNSFIGKYGVGSIINDNRNSTPADHLQIHHNYFADRIPINEVNEDNDQDAIRIGNSSTSLSNSFTEVYENYFYNFAGEVEVISNKSGKNKYYNNTFRDYSGTLTLRHGNDCEVYGNYFIADDRIFSGGIRVIGEGHKIYNNYIEGINYRKPSGSGSNTTGGINVSNGRRNSELNGYYQVRNVQIVNNTFVDCDYAIRMGTQVKDDLDQPPQNITLANNITYNSSIEDYQLVTEPIGTSRFEGNLYGLAPNELDDDGNFHRLTSSSPPRDAGVGTYSFLTDDILGGARDLNFDAGAEEFGTDGTRLPYTNEDVGINVGFGTLSKPTLSFSPASLEFGVCGGSLIFDVISNVNWTISEDIPWLDLAHIEVPGNKLIAQTTENTTGEERRGSIIFSETGGGDLTNELSIVQLITSVVLEVPITGTTSIGMQDKEGIAEVNAYNDNIGTYWTGNPDTEDEVSITFDLGNTFILKEIGINFWNADERTTTFSIAISEDADGPYDLILDSEASADSDVTVETEQLFDLAGTTGRYVKFIGIGNSSSTNWTSIANVNIYGKVNCDSSTSILDDLRIDQGIKIFPVPNSNGELTISSTSLAINKIEIYNLSGQRLLVTDGSGTYLKQIDISNLSAGIYLVKLEDIGTAKIIIR